MSVRTVCKMVEISEPTFYRFRDEDDQFTALWHEAHNHAIKQMKYEAEECVANAIRKGSERSAWWFLSHKHPSEYAEKRILDQTVDMKSPYEIINEAIDHGGKPDDED